MMDCRNNIGNSGGHMHPDVQCSPTDNSQDTKQRNFHKEDAVYSMGYSSGTKRREIWSVTEMCIDLETVLWSKASKKEKNKYPL